MRRYIKLLRILQNPYWRQNLLLGAAAGVEHAQILKHFTVNCVVDIGANRGQFALVAREIWQNAQIFSFEPLRKPALIFKKIFQNDNQVSLFQCAIGEYKLETFIHVSKEDDSSSLLPISKLQSTLFPGTEEKETQAINISPLTDVFQPGEINQPALLKIDVQGYELQVLLGSEQLLSNFDYIYVECSFVELYLGQALAYEIIDFLHQRGFILNGVYNLCYDRNGSAVQGDFLFRRKPVP